MNGVEDLNKNLKGVKITSFSLEGNELILNGTKGFRRIKAVVTPRDCGLYIDSIKGSCRIIGM